MRIIALRYVLSIGPIGPKNEEVGRDEHKGQKEKEEEKKKKVFKYLETPVVSPGSPNPTKFFLEHAQSFFYLFNKYNMPAFC